MKIFNSADQDNNLKIRNMEDKCVFNKPTRPLIKTSGKLNRQKQKQYDDTILFFQNLNNWNKNGSDVLARFLSLIEGNLGLIDLEIVSAKGMVFRFLSGDDEVEVTLMPRLDKDSYPKAIVSKGNLIKSYSCFKNINGELLVNLEALMIKNGDQTVFRNFTKEPIKYVVNGYGYLTEVSISSPCSEKITFNEEEILLSLLNNFCTNDSMGTYKLLNNNLSEILLHSTTRIKVFAEPNEANATEKRELFEELVIFNGTMLKYRSQGASETAFERVLSYEDCSYLDSVSKDESHNKSEKAKCDAFVTYLAPQNSDQIKELYLIVK